MSAPLLSALCYIVNCCSLPGPYHWVLVVISPVIPLSPHPSLSLSLSGGLYICCSQTGKKRRSVDREAWRIKTERGGGVFVLDPYLRCIFLGEEPAERSESRLRLFFFAGSRSLDSSMVVLVLTANARPVVQWFSSIMTLMMDVTEVSLLRRFTAAGESRVAISTENISCCLFYFDLSSLLLYGT